MKFMEPTIPISMLIFKILNSYAQISDQTVNSWVGARINDSEKVFDIRELTF